MDTMTTGLVRRIPGIRLLTSKITPASGTVEDSPPATELISGDGGLCEKVLEDFIKLRECGVSYAVVAIMGPQSSGKSTLLNHLFDTNFTEMVASSGRSQTTKGIWIAKARNMDPFTMVMDVEGRDAEERGEDDTTFEKQSTLFALAVADIVLINMWCHDIGRENAANRPLLKTIFEVMMRLFPSTSPRKTTLHFVIRDKTTSPIQTLETKLKTDVQKIWEIVPKTEDLKNTPLTQYFNVEVDALSNYEYMRKQFKKETLLNMLDKLLSEGGGYAESVQTCRRSCELEFDQRCSDAAIEQAKWDASTVRKELVRDIQNHALLVHTDKCRALLAVKVTNHLNCIFRLNIEDIAWASIREFLKREIDSAASAFRSDVAAFELEQATLEQKVDDLKQSATKLVENKFKEETDSVLDHMKERFVVSTGIYWEPLPMHKKEEAFRKCLKLLSTMAVIRLDESSSDEEVESVLVSALIGGDEVAGDDDPLASHTWEKVLPEMTLITPVGCKDIWVQFKEDIELKCWQTESADKKANESCDKQMPDEADISKEELPYWMRVGVWVLGVGGFVKLLWSKRFDRPLFVKLTKEGIELVEGFPEPAKEKVKNVYKSVKGKHRKIMKKLKKALKRFYNSMKGIFTKKSMTMVEVVF